MRGLLLLIDVLPMPNRDITFILVLPQAVMAFHSAPYYAAQSQDTIDLRYIRVRIPAVHAYYGNIYDLLPAADLWDLQCDPTYPGGVIYNAPIDDKNLGRGNDCFASIVEINALKEIMPVDNILPLGLQRIDNNSSQIKYFHTADPVETTTTSDGFRKFEPGGFFRRFSVTYTGAATTYTKFFANDCTNCYPDGFNFGIMDQVNNLIVSDYNDTDTVNADAHLFTSHILMKGSADAVVTYCDSWPSVTDPFSWGAPYSYSIVTNDYFSVRFRGQSWRWYGTIPDDQTPAVVRIEIRQKDNLTGTWSGWTTVESAFDTSPYLGQHSVVFYEIPYESGLLYKDTIYEIQVTNLGGYCPVGFNRRLLVRLYGVFE